MAGSMQSPDTAKYLDFSPPGSGRSDELNQPDAPDTSVQGGNLDDWMQNPYGQKGVGTLPDVNQKVVWSQGMNGYLRPAIAPQQTQRDSDGHSDWVDPPQQIPNPAPQPVQQPGNGGGAPQQQPGQPWLPPGVQPISNPYAGGMQSPAAQEYFAQNYQRQMAMQQQLQQQAMGRGPRPHGLGGIMQAIGPSVMPLMMALGGMAGGRYGGYAANGAMQNYVNQQNMQQAQRQQQLRAAMTMQDARVKNAYDMMQGADPDNVKNQVSLMNAQANQQRAGYYGQQVGYQGRQGDRRLDQQDVGLGQKQQEIGQHQQEIDEQKNRNNELAKQAAQRIALDVQNGQTTRELGLAHLQQLKGELDARNKELDERKWSDRASAFNSYFGTTSQNQRADQQQQDVNTRAGNEMVLNPKTGKMEPKYSAGFVDKYGIDAPDQPPSSNGFDQLIQGIASTFGGQPAKAAESAKPLTRDVIEQLKSRFGDDKQAAMEAARKMGYQVD